MKQRKSDARAAKINKILDKAFKGPNLYKFLIDRCVDSKIAEDAQEFMADYMNDHWLRVRDTYIRDIERLITPFERVWQKAGKKISAVYESIEEGYIR